MSTRRRRLLRATAILVVVLLLPPIAVLALAGTETGTRWLLGATDRIAGPAFDVDTVSGRLLDGVRLGEVRVVAGDTRVSAGSTELRWRPGALVTGMLHVRRLRAERVRVALPEADPEGRPAPPELRLPLAVRVDEALIADLVVQSGDTARSVDRIALAASIDGVRVELDRLEIVAAPHGSVRAAGTLGLRSPWPVSLRADWHLMEPAPGGRGSVEVEGTAGEEIRLRARAEAPFPVTANGRVTLASGTPHVDLDVRLSEARWPLDGDPTIRSHEARIEVHGPPEDLRFTLDAAVEAAGVPVERVRVTGSGRADPARPAVTVAWEAFAGGATLAAGEATAEGDARRVGISHRLSVPFAASTRGWVVPDAMAPALDLATVWAGARWPLRGEAVFESPEGMLRVAGSPDDLAVSVSGRFAPAGDPGPPVVVEATASGRTDPVPPHPFGIDLAWRIEPPGLPPFAGSGRAEGDAATIELRHALETPVAISTEGRVRLEPGAPHVDVAGTWSDVRWPLAGGDPATRSRSGRYAVRGALSAPEVEVAGDLAAPGLAVRAFEAAASLTLSGETTGARLRWSVELDEGPALRGEGSVERGATGAVAFAQRVSGALGLEARGTLSPGDEGLGLSLDGSWSRLAWPIAGAARVTSEEGTVRLRGPLDALETDLRAAIAGPDIPEAIASLRGTLHPGRLAGASITVEALGGTARAEGEVAWTPAVRWDLDLEVDGVDPGVRWPEWSGRLGARARADGEIGAAGPRLQIALERLDGRVRGHAVHGEGTLAWEAGRLAADGLELRSGPNRVRIDGHADERLDLRLALAAPDLAELWPGLAGRAEGDVRLGGTRDRPAVELDVEASALRIAGRSFERVSLRGRVDPEDAEASRVVATAGAVRGAGPEIRAVRLEMSGNARRHELSLEADGPALDVGSRARGGWDGTRWSGTIESLDATMRPVGRWRLATPVDASVGAGGRLERACLANGDARLCAAVTLAPDGGVDTALTLAAVPLGLAAPWLPGGIDVEGTLDGEVSLATENGRIAGDIELTPSPGAVVVRREGEEEPFRVPFRDGTVTGSIADGGARFRMALVVAESGRIEAEVDVGGEDPRPLGGRVNATLSDLALVRGLAPGLEGERGRIDVEATLDGTLASPLVRGRARLRDGATHVLDLGIELTEVDLAVRSDGDEHIRFVGSARSGEGRLRIAGDTRLAPQEGWPTSVEITGERFEITRLPEVRAVVDPELAIRLDASRVEVTGRIAVPSAHVRLRELPASATAVSSDEVVVGEGGPEPAAEGGSRENTPLRVVSARIELTLGDDVRLEGFGLETRLAGDLALRSRTGEPALGQGELRIVSGRFRAYGQDLAIEKGRLIFSGPLDDPALDVRAARKAGDVTAGVHVGGTARALRSRLFSDPPMAEAEILSYLLTGRPLAGSSQSEGALLAQAALGLGLERSQTITSQIGQRFGLDTLTVEGGGGTGLEESAVVLGKYLTPDLYVSYALGLFDQTAAVRFNYRLTERLSLEAESGRQQSMDLLYRIERDRLF